MRRQWEALSAADDVAQDHDSTVNDLRSLLHKLAGSAGSYGFDALGDHARAMERYWIAWLANNSRRRPTVAQACRSLEANYQRLLKILDDAIQIVSQASEAQE